MDISLTMILLTNAIPLAQIVRQQQIPVKTGCATDYFKKTDENFPTKCYLKTSPPSGHFLNTNTFDKCEISCSECNGGSKLDCIKCNIGYFPQNSSFPINCIDSCPEGYTFDSNKICKKCEKFINGNNCIESCPQGYTYDSNKICKKCEKFINENKCDDNCPDEMISNYNKMTCMNKDDVDSLTICNGKGIVFEIKVDENYGCICEKGFIGKNCEFDEKK